MKTMSGDPFTLEQVLEAARKVVARKGEDYVYEPLNGSSCVYAKSMKPSCLVGHVVHELDPEAFRMLAEQEATWGGCGAADLALSRYLPRRFWTWDAAQAMNQAQDAQDSLRTWGEALYVAENLGADAD